MDLEVVGRHALLFDDDAMAAFVNSGEALVEWHSLQIDRYDVRHLLSAPPPPRRRSRNFESKSYDEFLIDQDRYLDLPPDSDQPEVEDDEKPSGSDSYHSVAFSYGNTDDSADQKNTDGGMESTGYLPLFAVPGNIVQSLPPTEKVHQIIARTALFVSNHGGQSEIILRVKQGDNPTFGFLMPDHHLHAYFKYLVEHPELLHTDFDEKSQDERKKAGSEYDNSNSVVGALSLLGSVYGSGEDEDGDDAVNLSLTYDTNKVESMENAAKDDQTYRKPILSNKENVPTLKKNSSIIGFKPKILKSIKKEGSSCLYSAAEDKSKNNEIGATSKPPIIDPPLEFKRLIDKLVEFVIRNGKQFEATLLEQDSKRERFPFLLPSNQYHPYYLKVLQAARELKVNGKSYSGKDDLGGHGINKKASALNGNNFSYTSDSVDVPFDSYRKEKFKMVIGKSKKEEHETEKGTQESGVTVDAAAAAAILQAATRGIKNSDSHNYLNRSEGGDVSLGAVGGADSSEANLTEEQKRKAERLKKAKMFVAMLKSGAVPTKAGTSRGSSVEPLESVVLRSGDEVNLNNQEREGSLPAVVNKPVATGYLGERQSERLSKRKYRSKSGGCEDDGEDSDREEHVEDHLSRPRRDEDDENDKGRHQSHSSEENKIGGESSEEDRDRKRRKSMHLSRHSLQENDWFEGIYKEERDGKHKRKHRSRSERHKEDDSIGNTVEKERKHRRRRLRSHSSSEETENEEQSNESDREHKHYKSKHHSHHSQHLDREREGIHEDERVKKLCESRPRRRHGSRSKRHEEENDIENAVEKDDKYYRKRYSSHSSYDEEKNGESSGDDTDVQDGLEGSKEEKDRKQSKKSYRSHHSSRESSRRNKKNRTHRSSQHSRDKQRHGNVHSSRDKQSRHHHKHDSSSDDELQHQSTLEQHGKETCDERGELEEGEISSKVSEESRGITDDRDKRGTSIDVMSSHQRAPSQHTDNTDIPADLRAKIRAMLMVTRS